MPIGKFAIAIAAILTGSWLGLAHAYDLETHRLLSERALAVSEVGAVLRDDLGFPRGIESALVGGTVADLVGDGAVDEDRLFRVLNHFHNPLATPWPSAGLIGTFRGQSSVLWQQNSAQSSSVVFTPVALPTGGGDWSWQLTRQRFLTALTAQSPLARDAALADVFRGLGHVMHLIQDASVPAHARNDPHPPLVNPDAYESWTEAKRVGDAALFARILSSPRKPLPSIFAPTTEGTAPVPIARLIDTDKFLKTNANVLAGLDIGLAEYANGNFLSGDTRFVSFVLPLEPDLAAGFLEPEGRGHRRYFPKRAGDGEPVRHFVAEAALFRALTNEVGSAPVRGFKLDDKVHTDYASLLLPRAVGYSAALLDYFFRGRLDVQVAPDPDDPTNPAKVILRGVNASPEPLVQGQIALYADAQDGQRTAATPLGPTTVAGIAPGASLPPLRFQIPANTERFMAVYQGTLGNEVADGNFVGAVIGKALGGVRVEEVFSDGVAWRARTPTGAFLLPISPSEFEVVKWGDEGNSLVARSAIGTGQPNRVAAYRLQRQSGSVGFVIDGTAPEPAVAADKIAEVPFPFGLDLGTTVNFSASLTSQQVIPVVHRTLTGEGPGCDNATETLGGLTLVAGASVSAAGALNFPIVLDAEHHESMPNPIPYIWRLEDIALGSNGHIQALISVRLTDTGIPPNAYQRLTFDGAGNLVPMNVAPASFGVSFPPLQGPLMWALIDVTASRVLASTAAPTMTMISHGGGPGTVFEQGLWVNTTTDNPGCGPGGLGPRVSIPDIHTADEITDLRPGGGGTMTVTGLVHDALASALVAEGFVDVWTVSPGAERVVETFRTPCNGRICAYRVIRPADVVRQTPGFDVRRVANGGGAERLVMLARDWTFGADPLSSVLAWDVVPSTAKVAHTTTGFIELGPVTRNAAVITKTVSSGDPLGPDFQQSQTSTLVVLDAPEKSVTIPDSNLVASPFVLLGPSYLYNTEDLKFYVARQGLEQTALPAPLADVAGNPAGHYHVITLP